MGIQIASLFATIGADTSGLNKGLGSAKQSLTQFGGEMAKTVIGTVSLAAAVYKAGQVVVDSVTDWADYADSMRLSAQMAGVTTEEMSRLVQAADDFRVPMETVQKSMEMALKNGFVPTIDNIADLSDKLLGITDPAKRAAEASKIFGKSYADMMPFLLAGGDAIRAATTGIADNLVVTEQAAEEAKAYKDNVDALSDTWTGFKNEIGKAIIPSLTSLIETLSTLSFTGEGVGGAIADFVTDIQIAVLQFKLADLALSNFDNTSISAEDRFNALALASGALGATTVPELQAAIANLEGTTADLIMTMFNGSTSWQDFTNKMNAAGLSLGMLTEGMYNEVKASEAGSAAASTSAAKINGVDLSAARAQYQATADTLRADLAGAYDDVAAAEENWRTGIAGQIKGELQAEFDAGTISAEDFTTALGILDQTYGTGFEMEFKIKESIPDLVKTLLENPEDFASKASAFEDYFMPLDESVKEARDKVAQLQLDLIKLARTYTIKIGLQVGFGAGGGAIELPNGELVPQGNQASGGLVFGGTPYIVGERGPELFVPNANGQVVPNNQLGGGNGEMLGDILLELQNQPSRMKVAIKEALALVGG